MKIQIFQIKRGKFKNARGKYSRFLNIYCSHCGEHILLYQKDGPGVLKRLYLDRIFAPEKLSSQQNIPLIEDIPQLFCSRCERLIAIPGIFSKEQRNVYLLLSYSFIYKISKGYYPPDKKRLKHV